MTTPGKSSDAPEGAKDALVTGLSRMMRPPVLEVGDFGLRGGGAEDAFVAKMPKALEGLNETTMQAAGPIPVYELALPIDGETKDLEACSTLAGWRYLIATEGKVTAEATVGKRKDGSPVLRSFARPGNAVVTAGAMTAIEKEGVVGELRVLECLMPNLCAVWVHPEDGEDVLLPVATQESPLRGWDQIWPFLENLASRRGVWAPPY